MPHFRARFAMMEEEGEWGFVRSGVPGNEGWRNGYWRDESTVVICRATDRGAEPLDRHHWKEDHDVYS